MADGAGVDEAFVRFARLERFLAASRAGSERERLALDEIARAAAAVTGVTLHEVLSRDKTRRVSAVRDELCLIARDAGYTCREIAWALGRHYTVIADSWGRAEARRAAIHGGLET